ncbi:RPL32 [Symbiodinium sp. KB8]|nr:RPL32 [Symbiodinium sp. KB8]
MAKPTALTLKKRSVKRTSRFPRWQAHQFKRVKDSWRAPRGIDGRFRRKFKGTGPHVNIGYGTDARVKHVLPNGFKKFRVFNAADVDLLLMHNRKYAVEIATKVSAQNREAILERAAQLCVRVINGNSKKHEKQESE